DSDITKMSDAELSRYRNQHIGFVFQFFYLQPFLNLRTNVEVPAMFSKTDKPSRAEYASEMIDAVGMSDRLLHLPKELSGGQMQRAAIARALVNKPRLLIADEPTGNLDSENAGDVMDLFDEVRHEHKTAVLLVTHDESIAARADRIIRLKDGRVQS
ncbi:MAG: ABC transporter ATP-binding protein, partial [Patescibacteria group bacterium]